MVMRHFSWHLLASGQSGPGRRSRFGMAYDDATGAVVLFGGIVWRGNGQLLSDTWELRGGKWFKVEMTTAPAARHRGGMVYDAVGRCPLLFGGQSDSAILNDTWFYRDGRWRQWRGWLRRRPGPRFGHAMAFSPDMGVAVVFGGAYPLDRTLGDTWVFDGRRWAAVHGPAPSPRRYAAMGYHPGLKG